MKIHTILISIMLLVVLNANAQNETMYIMKNGVVILKQSVKPTDVDSIIFYEPQTSLVADVEGNIYETVTIGSQIWMKENLKVTKYKNGTSIPTITVNLQWDTLTTPCYCWYNNDKNTYGQTYGALYNWYAVNTGDLCPTGWHVPSDSEWTNLITYLGGEDIAGGKLKETGTTHWDPPNTGATNESDFTALPGGLRGIFGTFAYIDSYFGYWWTATEHDTDLAGIRLLSSENSNITGGGNIKVFGCSVRCIKD